MNSLVLAVPIIVAVVWLTLVVTMWTKQERFVFFPPRITPERIETPRITYQSADGVALFAYVVGTASPNAPVILAFHGNADLARWFVPWAAVLAERTGSVVVIPEYRGYDGVPGPPDCAGVARDAQAALAAVRKTIAGPTSPLVYFGHSLGAAVAAELAAQSVHSVPDVLILQSPFTSARDMAKRMLVPGLTWFWSTISRIPYDNVQRVRELDRPLWVAHGERDRIIPVWMGRAVFATAKKPGQLLLVPKAGHNDVPDLGGDAYWQWISAACTAARNV